MYLKNIVLQNFRSYTKSSFDFNQGTTIIVGPNTAGKTNLIEAIFLLSRGKSFRADKEEQMIQFGQELARVSGLAGETTLEIILTKGVVLGVEAPLKKFLVNGVSKKKGDFTTHLASVLFSPLDMEIVVASPSLRRAFMDEALEQVDNQYRAALIEYSKALRQRNALLERARELGRRNEKQFEYWDKVLLENGSVITKKREEFIGFINLSEKEIFDFAALYDKSIISKERLLQYKEAEVGAGVTLVGPHRDDFSIHMYNDTRQTTHDVRHFGSRGQQRLVVLQLKLLELSFIKHGRKENPLLLLDDIFSELDSPHITHIFSLMQGQQTILTTTHKEFINKKALKEATVIELE